MKTGRVSSPFQVLWTGVDCEAARDEEEKGSGRGDNGKGAAKQTPNTPGCTPDPLSVPCHVCVYADADIGTLIRSASARFVSHRHPPRSTHHRGYLYRVVSD